MDKYLFAFSLTYTSGDVLGEVSQHKSYEDESLRGAWAKVITDLKLIRPVYSISEIQSLHIRFLGLLDEWHCVKYKQMPEFTFSNKTLDAIEQILADIFSEELRRLAELEKINQKLEELEKINQSLEELPRINQSLKKITLILEKIGRTKGIDV